MLDKIQIDFTDEIFSAPVQLDMTGVEPLPIELAPDNFYLLNATLTDGVFNFAPTASGTGRCKLIGGVPYPEARGKRVAVQFKARRLETGDFSPAVRLAVYLGVYIEGREQAPFFQTFDRYSPAKYCAFSGYDWQIFRYSVLVPDGLTNGTEAALVDSSTMTFYIVTSSGVNPQEVKDIQFSMWEE